MNKDLLTELRARGEFAAVMTDLLEHRPAVPAFALAKTHEEQYMIVERIKYHTAMQQGFDLLYQHLTGRKPGE